MDRELAVITGASSGIGMVFARRLALQYDLVLVARREDRLASLAAELAARHGTAVEVLAADLAEEPGLIAVTARIAAAANLALLVNNAGFGLRGAFWDADLANIERMQRLHVMAIVRLTHAALRVLVARNRGAIINVASISSFVQRPGSVGYGASKAWLASLTEGLWLDLRAAGAAVRVQALCPGFTHSEFHDRLLESRASLAPPSLWLGADQVVDASLRGLARGRLFVVPGWRYRLITAILTKLPVWLRLRVEAAAQEYRRDDR